MPFLRQHASACACAQEAKVEMDASAAKAREQMEVEKAATRADYAQRSSALNAETDELMKRLGVSRPAGSRARPTAAAVASEAPKPPA